VGRFAAKPCAQASHCESTTLASRFLAIRQVHIACVLLSGSGFCLRGGPRIATVAAANHPVLRLASYLIDIALLAAAILLTIILQQYPFRAAWLTSKVLLLIVYIGLGSAALRRARSRRASVLAFGAALLTYAWIIGVAVTHTPAGWLSRLHR
jgi:uncharacterized membrane protein SirB2